MAKKPKALYKIKLGTATTESVEMEGLWIHERQTRIGGNLWSVRDDKGKVLAKFASFVGIWDSNEAKLLTIVATLELSLKKEWLKEGRLIVE